MEQSDKVSYVEWIARSVDGDGLGECAEITQMMLGAFPELKRVRGHYMCPWWGECAHWWLTAPDGSIVDPTAKQFPSEGQGEYVPHVEGFAEPTGKCPNCGGYCWTGETCCSEQCHHQYAAYCLRPWGEDDLEYERRQAG